MARLSRLGKDSIHHGRKTSLLIITAVALYAVVPSLALAAVGDINTIIGNGTPGFCGDSGPAMLACFNRPANLIVAPSGDIYIADTYNNRIRKVDTFGIITTVAGNGIQGYGGDNGPAIAAKLYMPISVAADSSGNIYIADYGNHRIRKVDSVGIITTVAGNGIIGYSGDGGPATAAQLDRPYDVALDSTNNLYIVDPYNNRIRMVDTAGIITTVAGNGIETYSGDNGPATLASLYRPSGISVDSSGNIYIADQHNHRIRKVDTVGIITTVAGNGILGYTGDNGLATAASLYYPFDVIMDSGNIYIADTFNERIRMVDTTGIITTVAGNGIKGYSGDGGPAVNASLNDPTGISADLSGHIIIADSMNYRIRKVIMSCKSQPDGTLCDDSDCFTTEDMCMSEVCQGTPIPSDDGNPCTADAYDVATCTVTHTPVTNGTPCDDGNVDTINDVCTDAICAGIPKLYFFSGFMSPIDNPPNTNLAKAGQTIPVKWLITDVNGVPISDPLSFKTLTSYPIDCDTYSGDPTTAIEEYAPGSSGLQYLGDGIWQLNWKTLKAYAGQCRRMVLTLADYRIYTANFIFK